MSKPGGRAHRFTDDFQITVAIIVIKDTADYFGNRRGRAASGGVADDVINCFECSTKKQRFFTIAVVPVFTSAQGVIVNGG